MHFKSADFRFWEKVLRLLIYILLAPESEIRNMENIIISILMFEKFKVQRKPEMYLFVSNIIL